MIIGNGTTPLCHTHPIRGELELRTYGRKYYEEEWDTECPTSKPVKSFPVLSFIDGFGVFSNSYRSLLGFYITPAAMADDERRRAGSIFPLILGPHGSEFADVVKAFRTMAYLDRGIIQEVNGEEVLVCAFTMCYIGDMPQQAENSGFKGPRAHKFCRCCFAGSGQKTTDPDVLLKFDIVTHGRFHVQTKEMQNTMACLASESQKKAYGSQWGIVSPTPALDMISPALDIIMTRPFDPAHSEYNGLSNLMHFLLRDGILTVTAKTEYACEIRQWPFPPGWQRLQSPLHHLASYNMSAHARWSVIAPAFLRHWLKAEKIRPRFLIEARNNPENLSPVDYVVSTCAAIAKSNSVLMGRTLTADDRANMPQIIHNARRMFNQVCIWAAGSGGGASRQGSVAGSVAQSVVGSVIEEDIPVTRAGLQFMNDTLRPNIHVALHYPAFAEEYGLPSNCNTLTGENLHR
jgi:hypothetical protein